MNQYEIIVDLGTTEVITSTPSFEPCELLLSITLSIQEAIDWIDEYNQSVVDNGVSTLKVYTNPATDYNNPITTS